MPILTLCSDCGALVSVKPTRDRDVHIVVWSYCERCSKKRALEAKYRQAQKTIEMALSSQ